MFFFQLIIVLLYFSLMKKQYSIVKCCLATKLGSKLDNLISDLGLKAVNIVI